MKNKLMLLLLFVAAFTISAPAMAAPPEEDAKTDDAKADDAKADDTKTDAKAEETKTEEKADEKADSKEEAAGGDDGEAKADDAKAIETDEEAVEAAQDLYTALQQKEWSLALGLGLALLVFALRKMKVLAKVPAKALPWVSAALGIVGYVAAALMTEGASMMDAILGGFMAGAAAVGLWEMLLKNFLGSKNSEGGSGG